MTNIPKCAFHNLLIMFSNSLTGIKVFSQLEKELLKVAAKVQESFLYTISFAKDLQ